MHAEHLPYHAFTSRFDKAVNSLLGVVEEISADLKISVDEVAFAATTAQSSRLIRALASPSHQAVAKNVMCWQDVL